MVVRKIPDVIKLTARELRQNMTSTENVLWDKLRAERLGGKKFLRQYPIFVYTEDSGLGRYVIPDFVCKKQKLIIELDGNIHDIKEIYLLDKEKEKFLQNLGYTILRFKNREVIDNLDTVLEKIVASFS